MSYVARQLQRPQHASTPQHAPRHIESPRIVQESSGKSMNDEEDLLTVHEVAKTLRIDDTTVRRYIKHGVLEAIALPHRGLRTAYRIKRKTLNKILEGSAIPG